MKAPDLPKLDSIAGVRKHELLVPPGWVRAYFICTQFNQIDFRFKNKDSGEPYPLRLHELDTWEQTTGSRVRRSSVHVDAKSDVVEPKGFKVLAVSDNVDIARCTMTVYVNGLNKRDTFEVRAHDATGPSMRLQLQLQGTTVLDRQNFDSSWDEFVLDW